MAQGYYNCALSLMQFAGSSASKEGQFKIGVDFYHVEDTNFISGSTTYNFAYIIFSSDLMKISTGLLFDYQFNNNHQLKLAFLYER